MDGSVDVAVELEVDSPVLVVAFAGLRGQFGGLPSFEFTRALSGFGVKCAFVRDRRSLWYQRGVEGVGSNVGEVAEFLNELIRGSGSSRTVFVGASAGGYAAILFADLVGADQALAFCPQTVIDPRRRAAVGDERWPRPSRRLEAMLDPSYADLRPLLERRAASGRPLSVELHYARAEGPDVIHAEHIAGVPGVELVPHEADAARHDLPQWLKGNGRLEGALRDAIFGGGGSGRCRL